MYSLKTKKLMGTLLGAALLSGVFCIPALAATKTMTSVTVRVGAEASAADYANERINCDVWDSLDKQEGTYAAVDSMKYSVRTAEWAESETKNLSIGNEPVMKVYLQMGDDDYRFSNSYSTKTAVIKGGTLLSAEKVSDELVLTVKLDPISGQYDAPDSVSFFTEGYGNGNARWSFHNDEKLTSGAYDVYLYRENTVVKRLEAYQGTSYDFYPYMKKKGTYTVKVRTVPYTDAEKKHGKKSEWTESSGLSISEDNVSDGTGQGTWIQNNESWYFQHPDQSLQTNSWFMVNTKWYLFDGEGRMLTGFQAKDGQTYYLDADGAMTTGWSQINGAWYYFHSNGAMAVNTTIDGYPINANGIWVQ